MTKEDDHLTFDFSETADQAPAVINCTVHGLIGGVLAAVMVYLCWEIPWSPAGVARVLTVKSREGSVVHAAHPAGVSKSTTTSIWEVRNLASITVGKMLAASEEHRDRAMAGWQGVKALEELFGHDADGRRFGGPMLDGMAGGGGATCCHDGIDTGGHTSSLRATIADVESYELRYPILYLYRRQTEDSGGPGMYRGGAGVSMMYVAHGVDEIPTKILHTFGVEQPESPGLCGGYPSTTNQFAFLRDSNVRERFADGVIPQAFTELEGTLEVCGAYAVTSMGGGDVYFMMSMGGGGYGDPLRREPELVANDVERSLVSREWATRMYGVVLADGSTAVNETATAKRRTEMLDDRRRITGIEMTSEPVAAWNPIGEGVRLSEMLFYDFGDDEPRLRCACGCVLGNASEPYTSLAAVAHRPVQQIGPHVNPNHVGGDRFELREFYCPACLTLLATEIAQRGDPVLDDARLSLAWAEERLRATEVRGMTYVVAVDSGGTFSDCVVRDAAGGITRAKAPSTPPVFEEGVIASIAEAAKVLGLSLEELLGQTSIFAHGTTVATNVLITRTGAKTALLTTRGHEDAILIGRTVQKVAGLAEEEIIDVARLSKAEPLVPRSRIHGIDERVDRAGDVVVPLHLDRLEELAGQLREQGVESVAVSLLWSFLNPQHERALRSWLEGLNATENGNGNGGESAWFVTTSSELAPVIREYERTSTTVLNAYLTPSVNGYLERMRSALRSHGHTGAIAVMHSAGGVYSVDEARERGVTLLSSGPAGGMLGTKALAEQLGLDRVVATDVGGTSFDVGVVVDGELSYAQAPVFSKYPVALPIIDVTSIGAGGGSIAWVEHETGVLRVGPQSAGARPGPACYGAGGVEPTVTDANLALGRLDAGYFLGGRMRIDRDLALAALARVADPLGLEPEAVAAAITEIVDSQMADLIRKVTVERGLDPARFAVFCYGGAGGLHAASYAAKLGAKEIVVPHAAAVFSAFGIGVSDAKRVAIASDPMRAPFDLARWRRRFVELEESLRSEMAQEHLPTGDLQLHRFAALQFRGQAHTVRIPLTDADLDSDDGGDRVIDRFTELYEDRFGRGTAYRQAGVEALTFSVEATAGLPIPRPEPLASEGSDADHAVKGSRQVYLHEVSRFTDVTVMDADRLRPGNEFIGPAIVEASDTTVLVHAGQRLWVDGFRNLRIELEGKNLR